MNPFEKARDKYEKRKTLHLPMTSPPSLDQVPMEKPVILTSPHCIIRVLVKLPSGDVKLEFIKRNIAGQVSLSKLTHAEFSRSIQRGLEPILGGVETI